METRAQFAALAAQNETELELDRAALLIAAEEYPDLEEYLRRAPRADDEEQIRNRIRQLRQRQAQLN